MASALVLQVTGKNNSMLHEHFYVMSTRPRYVGDWVAMWASVCFSHFFTHRAMAWFQEVVAIPLF